MKGWIYAGAPGGLRWLHDRRVAESKAQSAKRLSWLPKPPDGLKWQVFELYGGVYEVMLCDPARSEYSKHRIHRDRGRIFWWITGKLLLQTYEIDKVHAETADEFVERMRRQSKGLDS